MNKKGFTLIELLAVIVILAIIALIATPIVLNIISDTKEDTKLRSAKFYLDSVELSIAQSTLKGKNLNDGNYIVLENGNLCFEGLESENCTGKYLLEVEIKGEVPQKNSIITIVDSKIQNVGLKYENKEVVKNNKNELIFLKNKYKIGQEVTFNPGDIERKWNVIGEDGTTVTLLMTENLGDPVAWYKYSNNESVDNNYGPKDVLEYLNSLTTNWNNVEPISNYTYINNLDGLTKPYGYQKITIKNGKTILTHKDGIQITEVSGISKARILSLGELFEIAQQTNQNLSEENLRAFIERNIETYREEINSSCQTVDEVINYVLQDFTELNYNKYILTYITVLIMVEDYGIESAYDILLPSYLYQNLDNDGNTTKQYGYWTSSSLSDDYNAWVVDYEGFVFSSSYGVHFNVLEGVRPVITVSKSALE